MGLDDSFKNIESKQLNPEQWELWLKYQERRRNSILGLLFIGVVIAAITAIIIAVVQ